ncbi:MAG: DUF4352 domain-containing protein [Thermoprotei archaeon]|nr:MAG: DUF4352 domain-containing protein [Thermoprotei archaeon]
MTTRAISPVIATVIIVSVAIAIAVAVAFWMTGITGLFTRYEKLEIISAYAESVDTPTNYFRITLRIRNTGSTDVTIDNIFINGVPVGTTTSDTTFASNESDGSTAIDFSDSANWISVSAGESYTLYVFLSENEYTSGQIVEVKLHTAAGNEYPKSVQLP